MSKNKKNKPKKRKVKKQPQIGFTEILYKFEDARSLVVVANDAIVNAPAQTEIGHAATVLEVGTKMLQEVSDLLEDHERRADS